MNSRPLLTIAQVVEQFDVSRATVRRGIESGRFIGASKDSSGRWIIPVESLIAARVKPRKTWFNEGAHAGGYPAHGEHGQGSQTPVDPLQEQVAGELDHPRNENAHELAHHVSRIAQLESELSTEKQLREAAERNADDLRNAMRMLEVGTTHTPATGSAKPPSRRRWWQRS